MTLDTSQFEQSKLSLSSVRERAYVLCRDLRAIQHDERRDALLAQADELWSVLDRIDKLINR